MKKFEKLKTRKDFDIFLSINTPTENLHRQKNSRITKKVILLNA